MQWFEVQFKPFYLKKIRRLQSKLLSAQTLCASFCKMIDENLAPLLFISQIDYSSRFDNFSGSFYTRSIPAPPFGISWVEVRQILIFILKFFSSRARLAWTRARTWTCFNVSHIVNLFIICSFFLIRKTLFSSLLQFIVTLQRT